MKIAMINAHRSLKQSKLKAQLTLQVHDELIVDAPTKEADKVVELLTSSMQEAANLDVPLVVDIGIGNNWDQAHWWIFYLAAPKELLEFYFLFA